MPAGIFVRPLTTNEQADNGGYTHEARITADALTTTTAATAQTLTIAPLLPGDQMAKVAYKLKTNFKNSADAAFNTSTMSVGDDAGVATHIAAKETNANGTVVPNFAGTAVTPYTAANNIKVTFNSMVGKNLNSLNTGEVVIFFQLVRLSQLEQAGAGASIAK